MRSGLARNLAGAGTALAGLGVAAAAYLFVGGLPGMLYAAGIALAALVGAVAILARRPWGGSLRHAAPEERARWWGRKSRLIAELELELAATKGELDEHRRALANLGAQLSRESEDARETERQLEERIGQIEAERDSLHELLAEEREFFAQTLEELSGGIGRHGSELAELEQELEALITR